MEERISMVHGSGGAATSELIGTIFAKEFNNNTLNQMELDLKFLVEVHLILQEIILI